MKLPGTRVQYFTKEINGKLINFFELNKREDGVNYYKHHINQGFTPTDFTFSRVIHSMGKLKDERLLNYFEQQLAEFNIKHSDFIASTLINAFGEVKNLEKVKESYKKLLIENIKPTLLIYNSLLKAYINTENFKECEEIYFEIINQNLKPDNFTLNTIMNGYLKDNQINRVIEFRGEFQKYKLKYDIISFSLLIQAHCKIGEIKEAVSILDEIKSYGLSSNIIIYTILIDHSMKLKNLPITKELIIKMKEDGIEPNFKTYSSLVAGLAKHQMFNEAWGMIEKIKEQSYQLNDQIYHSLIHGYILHKRLAEVEEVVLPHMKENRVPISIKIWGIIAKGYANIGNFDRVLDIFSLIKDNFSTPPPLHCINYLFDKLILRRDFIAATNLFEEITSVYDNTPNTISYNLLMKTFSAIPDSLSCKKLYFSTSSPLPSDASPFPNTLSAVFFCNSIINESSPIKLELVNSILNHLSQRKLYLPRFTCNYLLNFVLKSFDPASPSKETLLCAFSIFQLLVKRNIPAQTFTLYQLFPLVDQFGTDLQRELIGQYRKLIQNPAIDYPTVYQRISSFATFDEFKELIFSTNQPELIEVAVGIMRFKLIQLSEDIYEILINNYYEKELFGEVKTEFEYLAIDQLPISTELSFIRHKILNKNELLDYS